MKKIKFVSNFCPHYRIRLYEKIAERYDSEFLFYSEGNEWYWPKSHGVNVGNFPNKYLKGFWLGKTRITFSLPYYLLTKQYDAVIKCINGKFALPITYIIARLRRKPFILYTGLWNRLQSTTHRIIWPFTRYVYRNSDAIVVYGRHVKKYLVEEGVDADKIFVAPHAIDNIAYSGAVNEEACASIRESLSLPSDSKILLHLGRLEESKGVEFILKAFAKIDDPQAVLIIAGSGREELALKELTNHLDIGSRVKFVGYVPVDQAVNYYDIADIFVFASIDTKVGKEPWGLTANEVFNRGLPIIASDAVGAAAGGLVENNVNGIIVPEKDEFALADAMRLLLTDDERRKEYGKNAKTKIKNWDMDKMAQGFFNAIEYAVSKK